MKFRFDMMTILGITGFCRRNKRHRCISRLQNGSSTDFTLIEVTISIAVIAIGMVGIIALFPVGFQASRDAIGDNYSSQMAEQILHMVALQAKAYSGNGSTVGADGWGEWITGDPQVDDGTIEVLPTLKAGANPPDSNLQFSPDISDPFLGNADFGIFNIDKKNGIYYLESKSGNVVDFAAAVALWQDQIGYFTDGKLATTESTVPNKYGARLMLEISWPVNVPYPSRQKRYYMLDIFNSITR